MFRPLSYLEADVIIICYSVSDPDSINSVTERWLPEVRHFCPDRPVILAANKVDLRPAENDVTVTSVNRDSPVEYYVSRERGEGVANEVGAVKLIECSAKTRQGVGDVFLTAASAVISARRRRRQQKHAKCCIL